MNLHSNLCKAIFEGKYPSQMNYENYLALLQEGSDILNDKAQPVSEYRELRQLRAIRIALEYRLEMLRQFRKRQIQSIGQYAELC